MDPPEKTGRVTTSQKAQSQCGRGRTYACLIRWSYCSGTVAVQASDGYASAALGTARGLCCRGDWSLVRAEGPPLSIWPCADTRCLSSAFLSGGFGCRSFLVICCLLLLVCRAPFSCHPAAAPSAPCIARVPAIALLLVSLRRPVRDTTPPTSHLRFGARAVATSRNRCFPTLCACRPARRLLHVAPQPNAP